MKRLISYAMVVLFFVAASAFGVTVSIPNTTVNPGTTTVQIPINIDNANGVAGFQFTVTFDPAILTPQTSAVSAGSLTAGWMITPNTTVSGQISIGGFDPTLTGLPASSGSLVILKFNVVGNPANTTNLNFTVHILTNSEGQQIANTATGGTFHINGYSISGKVTLVGGTGQVTNVVLTLSESPSKTTTSPDSSGNYSFTDLAPGTYTITPQLTGYAFTPTNIEVNVTNANVTGQNFTGNALTTVSGTISYSGTQQGATYIGLFTSSNFSGAPAYSTQISSPGTGAYTIENIAPGTYYAAAFMDVNGDQQWQQDTEPSGQYSGNPFTLTAGQQKTGVNITLKEPLTLTVNSDHGSPVPSVGQHVYYTGDVVNASVSSPVSGTTGTRYVCTGWTGTGSVPATGTTTSTSFTINQNSSITWNWKTQYLLTYSADPAAGGTVTVNPAATGNWYDAGTPVQLTANPNTNYVFLHWILDGNIVGNDMKNGNNVLDIVMDQPHNVVAVFALNQPVLSVNPQTVQFYFNLNQDPTTKDTEIVIRNSGSGPGTLDWQINPANIVYQQGTGWINIYRAEVKNGNISGSLPAGEQETIILEVSRQGRQIGEYNAIVPVTSNGGNVNISVKMIINQPPVAEALSPSDQVTIETAVEFNARFTSNGGTIARSEWKIYDLGDKTLPPPLKVIQITGTGDRIILPFSMFTQGHAYYWTVQCWDSYGEASNISDRYFSVQTKPNLPTTIIDATETETVYLPDSTAAETAVFVKLASQGGSLIIRPLNPADFPGASSVFANLFDIRVENIIEGGVATIEFEVPGSVSGWYKYQYNNDTQQWEIKQMPSDDSLDEYAKIGTATTPGYTKITLQLKDGGQYDADGQANGIISDPSGAGATGGISRVSGGGSGCFIATAAFGSYQEHHVWILRQFRDRYLLTNPVGRSFVNWYYKHSPKYASMIAQSELLRTITRTALMPVYGVAFITLKLGMLFWLLFATGILTVLLTKRRRNG